ncbi:unnamed protein product [Acanthoscelides obtectus]|uniref:Uncharacterized protein n=1 Tax=Acanthoscelides obtectus TaxID=200917 RepID=A0A9P0M298_ACAOB|nr:unnamed protein product [Acanthoscelides obtectus]CAK1676924.1 Histone H4 transcription factor [Acanthoscelides obtectus]
MSFVQKETKRGQFLTKHLMKMHNYHWPSGHSRFRYRKDKDGIYRLQTVRYESLEVTEEMIRSESMQKSDGASLGSDDKKDYCISVSCSNEAFASGEDIIIMITDVDEQGNIIQTKMVESGTVVEEKILLKSPVVGLQIWTNRMMSHRPDPDGLTNLRNVYHCLFLCSIDYIFVCYIHDLIHISIEDSCDFFK